MSLVNICIKTTDFCRQRWPQYIVVKGHNIPKSHGSHFTARVCHKGTAHGEIACPKIGTGPDFIPKREIKKKCAAISRTFLFVVVKGHNISMSHGSHFMAVGHQSCLWLV